mmetsp:Transcript_19059/g.44520  ORF Transcript_19059/g.44520 Transcript_19059/m.44520 type:complete len:502 (-) Transcript_19059:9-1514(-)
MGKAEKLLDALAAKLWRTTDRKILLQALKAAAAGLPEDSKFRASLTEEEFSHLDGLRSRIQRRRQEHWAAAESAAAAADASERAAATSQEAAAAKEESEHANAVAAYDDVDEGDVKQCMLRCTELLKKALLALPAEEGKTGVRDALEGFLAVCPNDAPVGVGSLSLLARILSLTAGACAAAAKDDHVLGASSVLSRTWKRLLRFVLMAMTRICNADSGIPSLLANGKQHEKKREVLARLGCLVALVGSAAARRFALRELYKSICQKPPTDTVLLECIVSATLPVARSSLSQSELSTLEAEKLDLEVVLRGIGFVGVCKSAGLKNEELQETRACLQAALTSVVNPRLLLPEVRKVSKKLQGPSARSAQRLLLAGGPAEKSAQAAAAAIATVLEAKALAVTPKGSLKLPIEALLSLSGLPQGDTEDIDEKAAIARARGDLFFEDAGATSAFTEAVAEDGQEDEDEEQAGADDTASKAPVAQQGKKRSALPKGKSSKARRLSKE